MKKTSMLILTVIFLIIATGCNGEKTQTPESKMAESETSLSVSPSLDETSKIETSSANIEVSTITSDIESQTLFTGETLKINATVSPADATDKTITWTSSNSDVANVDAGGEVTTLKKGEAVITAESSNGKKCDTSITVIEETQQIDEPEETQQIDEPEETQQIDQPEETQQIDEPEETQQIDEPEETQQIDETQETEQIEKIEVEIIAYSPMMTYDSYIVIFAFSRDPGLTIEELASYITITNNKVQEYLYNAIDENRNGLVCCLALPIDSENLVASIKEGPNGLWDEKEYRAKK